MLSTLTAISPIDGRYYSKVHPLSEFTSEYGLIRYRVMVEIQWLKALAKCDAIDEVKPLSSEASHYLDNLIQQFDEQAAERVKTIEKETNHDVKAVEYFLKERCAEHDELQETIEFIHFACTSEDINNVAYALQLKDVREKVLTPSIINIIDALKKLSNDTAELAMLCRTHGQPASPSTLGKEIANVIHRLQVAVDKFQTVELLAKLNGATGNFNAHLVTYPDVNWQQLASSVISDFGLSVNTHTTQIEPHDCVAEYCHALARINTILLDFARDIWGYIAIDYFKQKIKANEVGSSTMPHKVNPIDFENAEGNLGIANALLQHFANKLPISRWQRDLTDSTVLRNLGVAFAHSELSCQSLLKGLGKLEVNQAVIEADLAERWEILAEPLQTVMRRYGIEKPYEKLKALTRGKKINKASIDNFIQQLDLPDTVKQQLLNLTPQNYIGLAASLAKTINE